MITECYVDGSFRPNGSAAAIVIYRNNKELFRSVKPVPAQSSMASECEAVMYAVTVCYACNWVQPTIYTDSKTLFDHFKGNTNLKNKTMAYYIFALKELEKRFAYTLKYVKRSEVFIPDDMCKNFISDAHYFHLRQLKDKT